MEAPEQTQQTPPKQGKRPRRWGRRVGWGLLALVALSATGLVWTLGHLEAPWVRDRVRALVADKLHLSVDYAGAAVGWRGVELRDLRLASMPADRDLAPDLLHVGRLHVHWRMRDLVRGGIRLHGLTVEDVTLTVVRDLDGQTSVERLLAALPPSPPEPPVPWSRLLAALQGSPVVALPDVQVRGVRARVLARQVGKPAELLLGDLALQGRIQTGLSWPIVELNVNAPKLVLSLNSVDIPPEATPVLGQMPWLADLRRGTGQLPLQLRVMATLPKPDQALLQVNLETASGPLVALEVAWTARTGGVDLRLRKLAMGTLLTASAEIALEDQGIGPNLLTVRSWQTDVALAAGTWADSAVQELAAHVEGRGLELPRDGTVPRVAAVSGNVAVAEARTGPTRISKLRAEFHGDRQVDRMGAHATLHVDRLEHIATAQAATLTDLGAELDAVSDAAGATLTVVADVAGVTAATGKGLIRLHKLHPALTLQTLPIALWGQEMWPILRALTAQVTVERAYGRVEDHTLALASGQPGTPPTEVTAHRLQAGVTIPPVRHDRETGVLTPQGQIQASLRAARVIAPSVHVRQAEAIATLEDFQVNPDTPLALTTHAVADVRLGSSTVHADVHKSPDALTWKLHWSLPHVDELIAMLAFPADLRKVVDWARLTLTGDSEGTITQLTAVPGVTQTTHAHLRNLVWNGGPAKVAADGLDLTLSSEGHGLDQKATVAVQAQELQVGRVRQKLVEGTGQLRHHPDSRQIALTWSLQGAYGLRMAVDIAGTGNGNDLSYTAHASASGLGALLRGWPLAQRESVCLGDPGLTFSAAMDGTWRGAAGILQGQPPNGPDGKHRATVDLERVACRRDAASLEAGRLHVVASADGHGRTWGADVQVELPALELRGGGRVAHVEGIGQHVIVELRDAGTIRASLDGHVARMTQDAIPGWTARDLGLQFSGWVDAEAVRVERFVLDNPGTGTHLELTGGINRTALHPPRVDDADISGLAAAPTQSAASSATTAVEPVPGHQGLELTGRWQQDLGAWAKGQENMNASGTVSVPFRIESGDLVLFRAEARVHLEDVSLALPAYGLAIAGIRGDLPTAESFRIQPTFELLGGGEDNAYTRWRFADHQPFLRRDDFLTIAKIRYRGKEFGPVAGNAGLDRDVFRLEQLEAALLGGKMNGQCIVRLRGEDTWVLLRGNATGLQVSGSKERFDANAALEWLPMRASLDGRAEILHVGQQHLRALLDVWDPYAEDAQSNRLRMLLKLGHPERVRMKFEHGFMDIAVELGGLGGVVQIDELRGIALGPVFQRWLDPVMGPMRPVLGKEAAK